MKRAGLPRASLLAVVLLAFCGLGLNECKRRSPQEPDVTPPQTQLYVATTGTDTGDCTDPAHKCLTIQYAHDKAPGSHVDINVDPGSYRGDVSVTKSIRIIGAGSGATAIFGAINIGGNLRPDVTINALALAPNGVQEAGIVATRLESLYMSDVIVRGYTAFGILVTDTDTLSIANSQILETSKGDGIRVNGLGSGAVLVSRSIVKDNAGDGIQINGGSGGASGAGTTIEHSLIDHNGEAGVQLEDMVGGALTIRQNCIRLSQTEAGLSLERHSASQVTVKDNNIASNMCGAQVIPRFANASTRYDMKGNWWGIPQGPVAVSSCAAINSVAGPIDFTPAASAAFANLFDCPR